MTGYPDWRQMWDESGPWRPTVDDVAVLLTEIDRLTFGPATVAIKLQCSFCGHWQIGHLTKAQIAQWLRVHRAATIGMHDGGPDRESTCPHPCGTPMNPRSVR